MGRPAAEARALLPLGHSKPQHLLAGLAQRVEVRPDDWSADDDFGMLEQLATDFDAPDTAYASRPDPAIGPAFPQYDHLARVDEWNRIDTEVQKQKAVTKVRRPSALRDRPRLRVPVLE